MLGVPGQDGQMIDPDLYDIEVAAIKAEEAERANRKKIKHLPPASDNAIEKFPDLTPEELMKLRMANVSENKVADYFGLTVDGLRKVLEEDDVLRLIFDAGPGRGKAKIQITQFSTALAGDAAMLKHFGEHHLDQKSKVTHEVNMESIDAMIGKMEAMLGQAEVKRLNAPDVVEGEFEEVSDAAKDSF